MRKITGCIAGLLLLLLSSSSWARHFEYGFKFGMPISSIRVANVPSFHISGDKPLIWRHYFESKMGITVSVKSGYYLGPKIYLGLEPGYTTKGANFNESDSKLNLNYWTLPVVLKYKLSEVIRFCLGPEFSKLSKATLEDEGREIDMRSFYDKLETSVFFGLEYQNPEGLGLGFRLNYGLTEVSETVWTDELGNIEAVIGEHNRYLLIYVSMGFK